MAEAANRAALIATLRSLDRADLEAVVRAARSSSVGEPAARPTPTVRIANTGRSALVVDTGRDTLDDLAPGNALELAIEQPSRPPIAARAGVSERAGFAGVVRGLVLVRVGPRLVGGAELTVDLTTWRHESARLGWPVTVVRSLGREDGPGNARSKTRRRRAGPDTTWRMHTGDPVEIAIEDAGAEVLIAGIGPDLADAAEPFLAIVRAAGEPEAGQ